MTKKSPATLLAILDTLASGNVVYSDAAIACGVRPNTFWHWVRASQLNRDPDLIVEYLGERMAFHHAVEAARQIALHDTRARTEKRSQHYLGEPVFFRDIPEGQPVAEDDIDLDEMLGPDFVEPVAATGPRGPVEPVVEIVPDKPAFVPDKPEPVEIVPDKPEAALAIDAAPNREPRNALEADLFRRLAAARAKNAPRADDGSGQTEGAPRGA